MAAVEHKYQSTNGVVEHADPDHTDADRPEAEHEKPEDWGWHAQMGRSARIAGWISFVMLLLLNIGNQTRHNENAWVTGFALLLALILIVDWRRRKNAWRSGK